MRRLPLFLLCVHFSLTACHKQAGNDDEIVDTTLNDADGTVHAALPTMNVDENLTTTDMTLSSPEMTSTAESSQTVRRPADSDDGDEAFAEEPGPENVGPSRATGGDVRMIFSADDYPPSAVAAGAQGTAQARLTIGPDGRVVGCDLILSTGNGALDSATCNIIRRRARFTPARDENGDPTTDTVTTPPINWRLES